MRTILVRTINESSTDYDYLFELWKIISRNDDDAYLDFSNCRFLGQNAVAFIGGMARLVQSRGRRIWFAWHTLNPRVHANLAQNGFLRAFGHPREPSLGNSIPFREDRAMSPHGFAVHLSRRWLGRGWISISDGLRDAIVGRVSEAYSNVFEHARSEIGLFTCGQFFPNRRELKLTMVDFGVGIPSNVRLHFLTSQGIAPHQLQSHACMQWAFQIGTSTKPGGRGLGLDLLASFVRVNDGRMEIFSHDGHALVTKAGVAFATRPVYFEGTLVNVSLRCDERFYHLKSEHPPGELF